MQENRPATKLCIACKSEIHVDASLCSICKSYQTPWRNRLSYAVGIAGGATVLVTILTYISSNYTAVRQFFAWRDQLVFATLNPEQIEAFNSGDGEVYVQRISFDLPSRYTRTYGTHYWINQFLKVDERLVYKLDPSQTAEMCGKDHGPATRKNLDPPHDPSELVSEPDKFGRMPIFYSGDDPLLEALRARKRDEGLIESPGSATVRMFSKRRGEYVEQKVAGVFLYYYATCP